MAEFKVTKKENVIKAIQSENIIRVQNKETNLVKVLKNDKIIKINKDKVIKVVKREGNTISVEKNEKIVKIHQAATVDTFATFLSLNDTPSSYSGQATKAVSVNAGETALEFTTIVTADEKVKYNADDATAGFLADKTSAGTGITLSEDNDKLEITNSDPDQTVVLTDGNGIDVTGTYPNFTITVNQSELTDIKSVTLVVAASDSVNPDNADFQCDGVDDDVEIQAAIDALPANGGTVLLLEGIFNITSTINIISNFITLMGLGTGTRISSSINDQIIEFDDITESCFLKNMFIIGDTGATSSQNCVSIKTSEDVTVMGCRLEDCGGDQIIMRVNSNRNFIINNFIKNGVRSGIITTGDNNMISGNVVRDNGRNGIILGHQSDNNQVFNNIVIGNDSGNTASYDGIKMSSSPLPSVGNVITNNICLNNDRYEINSENGSTRNIIINNVCNGTDHEGAINNGGGVGALNQIAHNITS